MARNKSYAEIAEETIEKHKKRFAKPSRKDFQERINTFLKELNASSYEIRDYRLHEDLLYSSLKNKTTSFHLEIKTPEA